MHECIGIVLKKISHHKIALLDKDRGRLDAIIVKPIGVGTLIIYNIDRQRDTLIYVNQWRMENLPLNLARHDILFLHHIFELCYYFVPLGSFTEKLFELCMFLYTVDTDIELTQQMKKIYLFKILKAIGVYPRLLQLPQPILHELEKPLTAWNSAQIAFAYEKKLDEWLRICIGDHPAIAKFKTMHYLVSQVGCYE